MIKLKFKNKSDEIIFFASLQDILKNYRVKIRRAEWISDEDLDDNDKRNYKEDE